MPKRIPHLNETILAQARRLFATLGYHAVEMKQVAAESGTSVGNLYNYFPSKPALFVAIKDAWRKQILETCTTLLRSEIPRREKILAILRRLYDDISLWNGLWTEVSKGQEEQHQLLKAKVRSSHGPEGGFGPEELLFVCEFEALLTNQEAPVSPPRWAILIITATVQMARRYPQETEQNWKFLEALVDKL